MSTPSKASLEKEKKKFFQTHFPKLKSDFPFLPRSQLEGKLKACWKRKLAETSPNKVVGEKAKPFIIIPSSASERDSKPSSPKLETSPHERNACQLTYSKTLACHGSNSNRVCGTTIEVIRNEKSIGFYEVENNQKFIRTHNGEIIPWNMQPI